ncbi:hypothetical protein BX666DRAFT_2030626 [Dichotomocladium elegans]|nr:hypothetical protein BX666DRAFT_2030626 [Dichotomocladium elegans]
MSADLRIKRPSCATLVSLALATLWSVQSSRAQCVLLSSSKACPAFSKFYVGLPGLSNRYSFLANATNVDSFDQGLFAYVKTANDYLTPLGCSGPADNVPYARYSLSRLCASLIQDATDSLPCNFQNNLTPPPLCQYTCESWVDSVTAISNDSSLCPESSNRADALSDLASQCMYWQGYNGTVSEGCIPGSVNEPGNCGFQDNQNGACQYCSANSTDECCSSVSCKGKLSAGAIAGIVIGCVVGVAMICAAVLCFCLRRKRVRKDNYGFTTYVPPPKSDYQSRVDRTDSGSRRALVSHSNLSNSDHNNNASAPILTNSTTSPTTATDIQDPIPPFQEPCLENLFIVVHPYPPQRGDELRLHVDDIICLAVEFDDGWAIGYNVMTGLKGAFPTICVEHVPAELLSSITPSNENSDDLDSSKVLIEDDMMMPDGQWRATSTDGSSHTQPPIVPKINLINVDRLRENVRRSMSLGSFQHNKGVLPRSDLTQHNKIPKRTASMRTTHYEYSEVESPTSPTLNTPFFDLSPMVNGLSPDQDVYELHDHHRHQRDHKGSISSSASSNGSSTWITRPSNTK